MERYSLDGKSGNAVVYSEFNEKCLATFHLHSEDDSDAEAEMLANARLFMASRDLLLVLEEALPVIGAASSVLEAKAKAAIASVANSSPLTT